LCSAYKSKESLGASVAKKMCFQRSSERILGESRLPKPGWKVIPQSRTGSRETPVAEFVVCSWHDQLPDVVGMCVCVCDFIGSWMSADASELTSSRCSAGGGLSWRDGFIAPRWPPCLPVGLPVTQRHSQPSERFDSLPSSHVPLMY